jgi:2-polyprenyl-6-methoxyphenol hydroxylase-like FAD-dependent oxidoreductase
VNIVINGLGVAGPALAYWLTKSGHDVLLVEQAPCRRVGGYVVDFWGIGYDIVEKMGLIAEIRRLGYQVREVRFVDRHGLKRGGFDVDVFGRMTNDRFTSLPRSDVSATIYRAIEGKVETIFGDSVAAIEEYNHGVHVAFDHAPPRDADLVIGADGLHSRVRQLAFGPESDFNVSLDYHVAAFEAEGYRPRDELIYLSHGLPGRQISRFSMRDDKTMFLFVFRDEYMRGDDPKSILRNAFADAGWEWPRIEKELKSAKDIYFDSVSQIRMDRWTKGRIALVGDAAACVSLMAGEGTGLAIAEAYVLAGELHACADDDCATAFARYERRLMPFVKKKQESAARFASSFAPKTSVGITFRNAVTKLMGVPLIAEFVVGRDLRDDITLPKYDFAPQ